MSDTNWQLKEGDPFAPTAPDTLEHLPSHHCAKPEIDPRFAAAHYGNDLKPAITDIKTRLDTKTPNVWLMMRIMQDAKQHIAMLESEAEQLRMSVHNARIALDESNKDSARYREIRRVTCDEKGISNQEFDDQIDEALKD